MENVCIFLSVCLCVCSKCCKYSSLRNSYVLLRINIQHDSYLSNTNAIHKTFSNEIENVFRFVLVCVCAPHVLKILWLLRNSCVLLRITTTWPTFLFITNVIHKTLFNEVENTYVFLSVLSLCVLQMLEDSFITKKFMCIIKDYYNTTLLKIHVRNVKISHTIFFFHKKLQSLRSNFWSGN